MIIIIDLDGTIRNIWEQFRTAGKIIAPDIYWPEEGPVTYWFLDQYKTHPRYEQLCKVWKHKNFFVQAQPYPGAIRTIIDLAQDHDIQLITHPTNSDTAHSENAEWVRQWFGTNWVDRLIQKTDRTTEWADILIDDNPVIKGRNPNPKWLQITFRQPYNAYVPMRYEFKNWFQVRYIIDLIAERI